MISGNATSFDAYGQGAFTEMHRIIRAAEWPIIGFCGGHQLIATAYDVEVGPMRRLRPGETDPTDLSGPGYLKEWGFMPVPVVAHDRILDGLGPAPVFLEMHYWEAKQIPPASSSWRPPPTALCSSCGRSTGPCTAHSFTRKLNTEWPNDQRCARVNLIYPSGFDCAAPDGLEPLLILPNRRHRLRPL